MSTALTDTELALGIYRYEDLVELRIVTNRTDLNRKQNELKFPKPIKTGKSQAAFFKVEVHRWLRWRLELRDATPELPQPLTTLIKKQRAKPKSKRARSLRRADTRRVACGEPAS
jgi:predicted DNA-binding transcriptional regulator AlpA